MAMQIEVDDTLRARVLAETEDAIERSLETLARVSARVEASRVETAKLRAETRRLLAEIDAGYWGLSR